jgi:hypothetical protein
MAGILGNGWEWLEFQGIAGDGWNSRVHKKMYV